MSSLIDMKWNDFEWNGCWVDYVTLTFDNTDDIDLGCSMQNFEIAVSHE